LLKNKSGDLDRGISIIAEVSTRARTDLSNNRLRAVKQAKVGIKLGVE
jgi:hypothetical protein